MRANGSKTSPVAPLADPSSRDVLQALDAPAASHGQGADDATANAIDDVLDVLGAARLLQVGRNTVYELVARNAIPHRRLGKQIRFSRAAVMRWLASWSSQGAKEGH